MENRGIPRSLKIALVGLTAFLKSDERLTETNIEQPPAVQKTGANTPKKPRHETGGEQNPYGEFLKRHDHADKFLVPNEEQIASFRSRLLPLLQEYKRASAQTEEFISSTENQIGFARYHESAAVGDIRKQGGKPLAIAVLSEEDYRKVLESKRVLFAYLRNTGLILTPLIECPDGILAAAITHELGHLALDLKGLSGIAEKREPVGSKQYFEEEVEMSELEGKVLDSSAKGALVKLFDKIIDKSGAMGQAGKYTFLEAAVTDKDLLEFEKMLKLEKAGRIVAITTLTKFKLLLEFRYIDRNYRGPLEGAKAQKVNRYRRLIGK